jgi:cyanophycinase-like exopeptidase
MFKLLEMYPDLLGIGIDENKFIVLHGDQFEVGGDGRVSVFDSKSAAKKKYITLTKGQKFDLRKLSMIH